MSTPQHPTDADADADAATVAFPAVTSTRALVIVDCQVDFCEGGALAVPGGTEVVRRVNRLVPGRGEYGAIIATRDRHIDPGPHFSSDPDFRDTWPPHCVAGTPGAEFHPELDLSAVAEVFSKGTYAAAYSGFEGISGSEVPLASWLRERGMTAVDIVGIATDHCVRATALDAVAHGFATRVLLDMTAGVAGDTVAAALAQLTAAGVTLVGRPVAP